MSKFFIEENETVDIKYPDNETITIKAEFSQEDSDYIMNAMLEAETVIDDKKKPEAKLSMKLGKLATLERAIVGWSFKDDTGKPIPITKENIARLRTKYRGQVIDEINRLNEANQGFLATSPRVST